MLEVITEMPVFMPEGLLAHVIWK